MSRSKNISRRRLLQGMAGSAALAGVGAGTFFSKGRRAHANPNPERPPKFLITIGAVGGASIIDSMLAIRHSESSNFQNINCFPDNEVVDIADSPFRAVNISRNDAGPIPFPFTANQSDFVNKHKQDLMVVTATTTSVNHAVAQHRALTGNSAWSGRTLQEVVALEYGENCPLPNVNMGVDGYLEDGFDKSIPSWARKEPVGNAALWPLSLDGSKGIKDLPSRDLINKARELRDNKLDPESAFAQTFRNSEKLSRWQQQRTVSGPSMETLDLISKLSMIPDQPPQFPVSEYGLNASEDAAMLQQVFPRMLIDPFEAQAALAFLLLKNQVSVSVTLSPSFGAILIGGNDLVNPPLAFDFSHTSHRSAQALMWDRILGVTDRLIDLLKGTPFGTGGESMWDHSLIYVATDFGRSKGRSGASDDFSSGHDLNNGYAIISPLANGNTVLGGVDPNTGLTFGFDPLTGEPDTGRTMTEPEIFSGILGALQVETTGSGLPPVPAMRKS